MSGQVVTVEEELERCAAAAVVADIRRRIRWRVRVYRLRRFAREHRVLVLLVVLVIVSALQTFAWWLP